MRFARLLLSAILASSAACATAGDLVSPEIAAAVRDLLPKTQVDQVRPSEMPGVYEAYIAGRVVYVAPPARAMLIGHLFSLESGKDVTAEREAFARRAILRLDQLPLKDAIKTVKGSGKRTLIVFSDPDCPYCKQLERTMVGLDDVTVYTFLYPIEQLHPNAKRHAAGIWCQSNKGSAWQQAMLNPETVEQMQACNETPVDRNIALGSKLGIQGTPFLIRADGDSKPGAVPLPDRIAWLTPSPEASSSDGGGQSKQVETAAKTGGKP